MNRSDTWNTLADHFNVYGQNPQQGVLANVGHVEDALHRFLSPIPPKSRILDFGCGTGFLSNQLHARGYEVVGVDVSQRMIAIARENSSSQITYHVGESKDLARLGTFKAILSLMVFQFIEDIASVFENLGAALESGGTLLISVHSEAYILAQDNSHTKFINHSSNGKSRKASMVLNSEKIPIFIRSLGEYKAAAQQSGLRFEWTWQSAPYSDGTPSKYEVLVFCRE